METIQLVNISVDEFRGILRDEVSAKFNQLLKELKPEEMEVMNEKEAYTFLRLNPRTLKRMSIDGSIPCIPIGNGRFRYAKKVLVDNYSAIQAQKSKRNG